MRNRVEVLFDSGSGRNLTGLGTLIRIFGSAAAVDLRLRQPNDLPSIRAVNGTLQRALGHTAVQLDMCEARPYAPDFIVMPHFPVDFLLGGLFCRNN